MARTVRDPQGRAWVVEETGRVGALLPAAMGVPSNESAVLKCSSDDETFTATLPLDWRDLPDPDLWERLDRARRRPGGSGTYAGATGN